MILHVALIAAGLAFLPFNASASLTDAFDPAEEVALADVIVVGHLSPDGKLVQESDPELLNRAVIEPLREFAISSLRSGRLELMGTKPQLQYPLLHTLTCYFHPRLLPVMMKWADESSLPTRVQAASNVRTSLWLVDNKAKFDEYKAWWIRNKDVIEQCPEPTDPPSVAGWLGVFEKNTDPMLRKLLLHLWVFQPEVRERELLAACTGPSAESAKILLAELWQQKRLSLETRKQLIHDFLRLRIVVRKYPYTDRSPKTRVKAIEGDRQFPFPEAAWVDMQAGYADGRLPVLNRNEGPGRNFSLKGPVRNDFCGGTGSVDETKFAVVEIFETSFGVSPPKTLWRLRWELKEGEEFKQGEWSSP